MTNSCMSFVEQGELKVIPNAEGFRLTPSVVGFTKTGGRLVGSAAKERAVLSSDHTVIFLEQEFLTSNTVVANGQVYAPEEILAMILQKLKADAETYLDKNVTRAVITVPVHFNEVQRHIVKDAGMLAGLEVLRLISSPTAAALAYAWDTKKDERILVYDLGGGTFDVSVLEIGGGTVEVLAMAGNTRLGGGDFDERIVGYIADEFQREQSIDLRRDKQAMQRLREAAEKAKIELSSVVQTTISLPFIAADAEGQKDLEVSLSRAKFDELTRDLLERTEKLFTRALADAKIEAKDLDEIILVGGCTRIPAVQEMVKRLGGGKEPNRSVSPDEVVALGAGVQAGVLCGEVNDIIMLDITPLSLGIQTLGDRFTKLVERNTTIPHYHCETFSTAADGQTEINILIYQGERRLASQNKLLGRFKLTGIPPAPRGIPQIKVVFDIDAQGRITVSARDRATQQEGKIIISGRSAVENNPVEDNNLKMQVVSDPMDDSKHYSS